MTPSQINLVQQSWLKVLPISEQAAELFYGKLFELDPSVRGLFKSDLKEQGRKLMNMIHVAVNGLSQLDALAPAVQDLGRRHVRYGVTDANYTTVGTALLWTLQHGLGAAFTAEVREAWGTAYGILADTMKAASAATAAA
jgi:hemoglobin-like flavoprotein